MFGRCIRLLQVSRMNLETPAGLHAFAHRSLNLQPNPAQETLQRKAFVEVRELRGRDGLDRLGNRKKWLELRQHAGLWHCANNLGLNFTLVEQQHGGNAHDIEATSDVAVIVHVQLCNNNATSFFIGDFSKDRRNLLARSAPFSPEVHKDGGV
jgi:hypothetical protein